MWKFAKGFKDKEQEVSGKRSLQQEGWWDNNHNYWIPYRNFRKFLQVRPRSHYVGEIWKHNTGHFGFVFDENSDREITWQLSWRHRFQNVLRPHENAKPAFTYHLLMVGLTIEIKQRFRIFLTWCGRSLRTGSVTLEASLNLTAACFGGNLTFVRLYVRGGNNKYPLYSFEFDSRVFWREFYICTFVSSRRWIINTPCIASANKTKVF